MLIGWRRFYGDLIGLQKSLAQIGARILAKFPLAIFCSHAKARFYSIKNEVQTRSNESHQKLLCYCRLYCCHGRTMPPSALGSGRGRVTEIQVPGQWNPAKKMREKLQQKFKEKEQARNNKTKAAPGLKQHTSHRDLSRFNNSLIYLHSSIYIVFLLDHIDISCVCIISP